MTSDMDIPKEFLIRSSIGVFRMSEDGTSGDASSFRGSANGFGCELEMKAGTNEYSVSLCTDSDDWGFGEISVCGVCATFDGLLSDLGKWIDEVCPESIVTDNERDVRFFQTSKGKIAYYAYNTELGGIPVLMIHGGPGGDSNTERARKLMLDHPVYLYDQMGCGRSDKIADIANWGLDSCVNELKEFIDGMGFEKVILIGGSWGAGLSAAYAIATGCEKIELMILPSPFFGSKQWAEDQMENMKTLSKEYRDEMEECLKEYDDAKYKHVMCEYYKHFLFSRECNAAIAESAANDDLSEVFLALWGKNDLVCTGNLRDYDLIPDLGKINVRTLLMCGDSDEVTLETMCRYRSLIKGSNLSIIPNAGHALSFEQFDMYKQAVMDFLKECGL